MTLPLMVLAFFAVVAGFIGIPELFAPNAHALEHFLAPVFAGSKAL
jgi:NADH-quinone oxidoreductase subunit L